MRRFEYQYFLSQIKYHLEYFSYAGTCKSYSSNLKKLFTKTLIFCSKSSKIYIYIHKMWHHTNSFARSKTLSCLLIKSFLKHFSQRSKCKLVNIQSLSWMKHSSADVIIITIKTDFLSPLRRVQDFFFLHKFFIHLFIVRSKTLKKKYYGYSEYC